MADKVAWQESLLPIAGVQLRLRRAGKGPPLLILHRDTGTLDQLPAYAALAQSRELWRPTPAVPNGDLDKVAAQLELDRGRLDVAQAFAAASVRLWEGRDSHRGRTRAAITLATIHIRAGEPDGLQLAHEAITGARKLSSVRIRRRLEPLAAALEARPGSDHRELARTARQVATTRV